MAFYGFGADPRPLAQLHPYVTPALRAEWAMFANELAHGFVEHYESCAACTDRFPCVDLERGCRLAEEWLTRRLLAARARHLRLEEELSQVRQQMAQKIAA